PYPGPSPPPVRREDTPSPNYAVFPPNFSKTREPPLRGGRFFPGADEGEREPVTIISAVLAKNYFPDGSPIGRQVLIDDTDGPPRPVQIVGVVGPVKQFNLEMPARPDIYLPLRQIPKEGVPLLRNSTYWAVKTLPGTSGIESMLNDAIRNVDGNIAIGAIRPMRAVLSAALAARRFSLLLIGSFAGAALFLAAAGLYAVISYGI